MEFLLLPSGPSLLLLLLLHAGAIRICERQEDRIFGIPQFQFGCNILRPPPRSVAQAHETFPSRFQFEMQNPLFR
jgi:hypothetical protein